MGIFAKLFKHLLHEDVVSGTAFGPAATGDTGGQFPAQNSKGFADGDNRPIDPSKVILGAKKAKKGRKNKGKVPIQRRIFSNL